MGSKGLTEALAITVALCLLERCLGLVFSPVVSKEVLEMAIVGHRRKAESARLCSQRRMNQECPPEGAENPRTEDPNKIQGRQK